MSTSTTTNNAIFRFDPTMNKARGALYRYTALAMLDPRAGSWSHLSLRQSQECVQAAGELMREHATATVSELGLGELPCDHLNPTQMFARLPDSDHELNTEYEQTFGLLISSPNPPCETEYIGEKLTFQRSQDLADIAGFYRAFGLETSADRPERPDHIALELEFMAFLAGLERHAAESSEANSDERMTVCRDAQAKFLKDHLAWWVPTFAKLLSKERPDGFYAAVGQFLSALIPAERGLLGVKPVITLVGPSPLERPEECEGCLSSQL